MSKKTSKILSGLMEEAQRHTIADALYYIGDTHFSKEEAQKVEGGLSGPSLTKLTKLLPDNGKKSVFEWYTSLITTQREILNQVEEQNLLKRPKSMKSDPCKRDRIKYCQYHKDHGHDTKDNFELKEEVKNLIRGKPKRAPRLTS